jgi:hypothetical protein
MTSNEGSNNAKANYGNTLCRRDAVLGGAATCALIIAGQVVNRAQASVLSKAQRISETMEPALVWPGQEEAAQRKLDGLRTKTG